MKSKSLSYLLALVMVLSFAGVGCKKKPVGVTKLPNPSGSMGGDQPIDGAKLPPDGGAVGGGQTADWPLSDYTEERSALAAHTVYFAYDSHEIRSSEQSKVTAVAAALASDPATKLLVEGHCDERGTEEYNRTLGERRALAVRQALANSGLDPQRVRTISYGKDRKVAFGEDEASHSRNRRGEFVLMRPKN